MKITNLLFWVQENKLSEKFYKKIGFEVVRSDDAHSVVRLNGFEIILMSMRDEEKFAHDSMHAEKGKGMYVYVLVDDIDVLHGKLIERGLQPVAEPKDWPWGNREFVVKNPDGYKLCFWHSIKQSKLPV